MILIETFWGTLLDIFPIAVIIFGFQYCVIRKPIKRLPQVLAGFVMVWVGLSFFWWAWSKRCFPWAS